SSPRFDAALAAHGEKTLGEADTASLLVGALYAALHDSALFTALSMLYFAAASFTEAARRLRRRHAGESFLLSKHPRFRPAFRSCCSLALEGKRPLDEISRTVAPVNVAGLFDPAKRNWYAVEAADLRSSRAKLDATAEEIEALLEESGFPKELSLPSAL